MTAAVAGPSRASTPGTARQLTEYRGDLDRPRLPRPRARKHAAARRGARRPADLDRGARQGTRRGWRKRPTVEPDSRKAAAGPAGVRAEWRPPSRWRAVQERRPRQRSRSPPRPSPAMMTAISPLVITADPIGADAPSTPTSPTVAVSRTPPFLRARPSRPGHLRSPSWIFPRQPLPGGARRHRTAYADVPRPAPKGTRSLRWWRCRGGHRFP